MTSEDVFLVALALLYVWECIHWVAPGSVVFRGAGDWKVTTPEFDAESRLGVPVLGLPIPPLGVLHACAPWPVSMSHEGLTTHVTSSWLPKRRPDRRLRTRTFDSIGSAEASGANLVLDGDTFARCGSPALARRVAALVNELVPMSDAERLARLDASIAEWIAGGAPSAGGSPGMAATFEGGVSPVARRLAAERSGRQWLLLLANALLIHLVVVTPAVVLVLGHIAHWLWILPLILLLELAVTVLFVRLHRRLYPEGVFERWGAALAMAFFAPMAIRAHDHLVRDLAGDRHPLEVARVLLRDQELSAFEDLLRRDLEFPIPPRTPLDDLTARIVASFDARLRAALAPRLGTHVAPPHEQESTPSERALAHCPRCLDPFRLSVDYCPDCRVPVVVH